MTTRTIPLLALVLVAQAAGPASAKRHGNHGNHCILPWGADWNIALDTQAQLVIPACSEATTGERLAPLIGMLENVAGGAPGVPLVYPADYTPAFDDPMTDYLSKVVSLRYVVVTHHNRSFTYDAAEITVLGIASELWADFDGFPEEWKALPFAMHVPELPPLPPGDHEIAIYVTMTAEHCDGLSDDRAADCVPAGENYAFSQFVTVTPGQCKGH